MVKKLLGTGMAAAVFLSAAVPAFAWWWNDDDYMLRQSSSLRMRTEQSVSTGNVMSAGDDIKGGFQRSGDGFNGAYFTNVLNTAQVPCDCIDGDVTIRQRSSLRMRTEQSVSTGNVMVAFDDVRGGFQRSGNGGNDFVVTNVINTVGEETL